jgi:WD40 repeat protein
MVKAALRKLGTLPGILTAWLVLTTLVVLVALLLFGALSNPADVLNLMIGGSAPGKIESIGTNVAESVSWSPDGKYLAAAYLMGSSVEIWDVQSGRSVHSLDNFRGGVDLVSWSPDGKYLATASSEVSHTFRVWDTSSWQEVIATDPAPRTWKTISSANSISWSPDSKRVALGVDTMLTPEAGGSAQQEEEEMKDVPGLLKIFDVPSGQNSATLVYTGTNGVDSVDWSPDGKSILFGATQYSDHYYTQVFLWNLSAGDGTANNKNIRQLVREDAQLTLTTVRWSPDGKYIAGNSADNSVKVWDALTGDLKHTIVADGEIKSFAWSPDGTRIAAGIQGGATKWAGGEYTQVWDIQSEQTLAIFNSGSVFHTLAWAPDGKSIATSAGAIAIGAISIWGFSDPNVAPAPTSVIATTQGDTLVFSGHDDFVPAVAWSPDEKLLASGGDDKRVRIWNPSSRQLVATLLSLGKIDSVAWSPDGEYLAFRSALDGPSIQVWDTKGWKSVWQTTTWGAIAWLPAGHLLAVATGRYLDMNSGAVIIYDGSSGKDLEHHPLSKPAIGLAWSPNNKYAAVVVNSAPGTGDGDPEIWVFDPSDWHITSKFSFSRGEGIDSPAWSPNSQTLAVVSADWNYGPERVELLDIAAQKQVGTIPIDNGWGSVTWTPDGKNVVTTANLSELSVWDATSLQSIMRRDIDEGAMVADVSPDGRLVALGGWDGKVRVLPVK